MLRFYIIYIFNLAPPSFKSWLRHCLLVGLECWFLAGSVHSVRLRVAGFAHLCHPSGPASSRAFRTISHRWTVGCSVPGSVKLSRLNRFVPPEVCCPLLFLCFNSFALLSFGQVIFLQQLYLCCCLPLLGS